MRISPDEMVFFEYGFVKINFTIITTWAVMLLLVLSSMAITRKLVINTKISRWQSILEMIVTGITEQIEEVGLKKSKLYRISWNLVFISFYLESAHHFTNL